MKTVLLFSALSMGILPINSQFAPVANIASTDYVSNKTVADHGLHIGLQAPQGEEKILAVVFKKQQYCRVELKDFDFDARFSIVSATMYFSGTNFKNPEKGIITGNSLKPVSSLMDRCAPGTIVIFDNVKVIGPDNEKRTIPGASFVLY